MAWDLSGELASIRAEVLRVLPDATCVIERLSELSDETGGLVQSWAAVGTVVGRLAAKGGGDRATAAQIASVGQYTLTVPVGTDIVPSDVVVVGTVRYRVLFVDDVFEWCTATRCDLQEEL